MMMMMMMMMLLLLLLLLLLLNDVYCTGEVYNDEIYKIMQILQPIGSVIRNGTIVKSPITYDGDIYVSKNLYPSLFFFHVHIPKTGGTTFKKLIKVDNPQGIDKLQNCGFNDCCGKLKGQTTTEKVIASGCTYYSYEAAFHDYSFYEKSMENIAPYKYVKAMTLIRDPLDHAFSAIGHFARNYQIGDHDRCNGLHDYLGTRNCNMYDLNNIQTRLLGHSQLKVAKEVVNKFFWIGITDYYDASMCLLAYQLGQFNQHLCDCKQKPRVVEKPQNTHQTSKDFGDVLKSDFNKLKSMLTTDKELYAHALSVFFKRVDSVEKAMGFRIICQNDVNRTAILSNYSYEKAPYNLGLNKKYMQ